MGSKIQAARVAARGGVNCCVANGMDIHNISRVFSGEDVGTLFPAHQRPTKFQHWLLFSSQPKGSVILRDGVTQARAAPPAAPPPRRPAA
jgi:glutamate 5-kinase